MSFEVIFPILFFGALFITLLGVASVMFSPTTCRHGIRTTAKCRLCAREMDEAFPEEMREFKEQHDD